MYVDAHIYIHVTITTTNTYQNHATPGSGGRKSFPVKQTLCPL